MSAKGIWIAFGVGVTAGAVIALLYAPQPGVKTRRQLRRNFDDGVDYLEDAASYLKEQAESLSKEARRPSSAPAARSPMPSKRPPMPSPVPSKASNPCCSPLYSGGPTVTTKYANSVSPAFAIQCPSPAQQSPTSPASIRCSTPFR